MPDSEKSAAVHACWEQLQQFWAENDCIPTPRFAMERGFAAGVAHGSTTATDPATVAAMREALCSIAEDPYGDIPAWAKIKAIALVGDPDAPE